MKVITEIKTGLSDLLFNSRVSGLCASRGSSLRASGIKPVRLTGIKPVRIGDQACAPRGFRVSSPREPEKTVRPGILKNPLAFHAHSP
jgi:hypothetical protein